MSYFRTCPHCKANLDPGEICDCRGSLEEQAYNMLMQLPEADRERIYRKYKKKSRPRCCEHPERRHGGTGWPRFHLHLTVNEGGFQVENLRSVEGIVCAMSEAQAQEVCKILDAFLQGDEAPIFSASIEILLLISELARAERERRAALWNTLT